MATTTLTDLELMQLATESGEAFVEGYYTALNGSRHQVASFYVPKSTGARPMPHISYNGNLYNDASAFQERFQEMPYTHFEAQSVNAHVLNRDMGLSLHSKQDAHQNVSLTVQVSGYVRLEERKEGPMRGFSDSFVLVPNKVEVGGKGTSKQGEGKKRVIQRQNFRFVV